MKTINIISIAFLLFFAGSQSLFAQPVDRTGILHPKGLLWKIEKPGMSPVYLYGTMHVSDADVIRLPAPAEKAFLNADHFVMEMLLNFKAVGYVTRASFFDDGRTLKQLMGNVDYQKLASLANKRLFLPESALRHMKPWAVLVLLLMPVEDQAQGGAVLDMVLYRRAVQHNIPVMGLETPQEQVSVFDSMAMDEQLWLLNRAVREIKVTDRQMPEMLRAYLAQDLAQLVALQQQFMYDDSQIDDRFMHQLLDVRNIRMVKRLQPILEKGNAFIAIGALHLPTRVGVLHLLEQQGYRVSPVY
ncbi:hypothetical protein MNBD_GAMMA11-3385 [hydrothermal vent metagenome]|uniref:TraB/GumN family protein n=1 Tax=hydrothermal vent metagenome TaxID=652676 RepID=A0A3B0WWS0_9ZZZZ